MAINPYLNPNKSTPDQNLVESLIIECIKNKGTDCYYIPRTLGSIDPIYLEDNCSLFEKAYEIEMYFKNFMNWDGRNDFNSKFGLQIEEQGKLTVAIKRFRQITKTLRPFEGDLVYFPITDSLYEITFCEHESIQHQLGKLQVWDISIDLFDYASQKIRTGIPFIDKFERLFAHAIQFNLISGTGKFLLKEKVYQGSSSNNPDARGIIQEYDIPTKTMKLTDVFGTFDTSIPIIGATSNARYTISDFVESDLPNSPVANNKEFEDFKIETINYDENNPFGE